MRILLIGPDHDRGSIPPYLTVLTEALRARDVTLDRLGAPGLPYDHARGRFWPPERIVAAARELLDSVELTAYDLLAVHFGNLEIEQLLPALWSNRPHPPAVYHAHTLEPTLFTEHAPDPALHRAVREGLDAMEGFVHFGDHAATTLGHDQSNAVLSVVSWLPTTIPPGTSPLLTLALERALTPPDHMPLVSLYGFAAPWKDPGTLLAATQALDRPLRIVLAGPFWDDPSQAGVELRDTSLGARGAVELAVVPEYLDAAHRSALVAASDLAVFPYQPRPSFQGSGAIADYLARGVPVLGTDVANMAELIGDAGLTVPPRTPDRLATGLRQLTIDSTVRHRARRAARRRATFFTADNHARECLDLYLAVLENGTGSRR